MKTYKYALLLSLILVSFWANAAPRYARANGTWTGAIWATTPGGVAGSAPTPTATDDVYTNGFLVTINGTVPLTPSPTCQNLYITYNVANSLIVGNLRTLVVTGTLNGWNDGLASEEFPTTSSLNTVSGFISFTGANVDPAGSYNGYVIYFWDDTVPINRVIFNFAPNATFGMILPIVVSTQLQVLSGTLAPDPGVNLSGGNLLVQSDGVINTSDPISFNNLTLYGTISTSSSLNIANTFTMGTGTGLNSGLLNTSYSGANGWWSGSGPTAIDISYQSTVNYRAAGNQNVAATQYGNIDFSGSGVKTVASGGSVNITGNLTFNSTAPVFTSSQTVVFNGPNGQTITGGGVANFNGGLTINKTSGTLTVAEDINWQGVLNLSQVGSGVSFTNAATTTATGVASIVGLAPTFHSLAISGSGVLTGYAGNMTLLGNFTNNGTYNANNGTLTFSGAAGQTISGTSNTNFANITSTNSLSLSITSPQSISDALTLSAGVLNANGNLTLRSTSTRDARIAEITGGATISGNISVQRYIPTGSAVYRYISSPLTNATAAQWKSAFPITGTFADGSTQAEWPGIPNVADGVASAFSYNESLPAASLNDRYESFPAGSNSSSGTPLVNGKGYAVYMYDANQPTYTLTGAPKTGAANVSITAQSAGSNDGWNLVGNPYASPIDWNNVDIQPGMSDQVSIMDNTGSGTFVYYSQGVGTDTFNGIIASSQAFWVKTTTSTTIPFKEADKANVSNATFYREGQAEIADLLRVKMKGSTRADELALYFKEEAKDISENRFDAQKRSNPVGSINFSSLSSDGVKLAINAMGTLSCNKEVGLSLDDVKAGNYSFNFSNLSSFKAGVEIHLTDNFTGKTKAITASSANYDFEVTSDESSYGNSRFKLNFDFPGVLTNLSVTGENVCSGSDSKVNISNSQIGVAYYATIDGNTISESVTGNGGLLNITIPHTKLANGENQVVVMASSGACTTVALSQVSKIITDHIYMVTSVKDGAKCQEGSVTLTAAGAPSNGSYKWYESTNPNVPISGQTNASYTTPLLTKSKTYLVAVVNSLGCEGEKKEVNATITNFDTATITELGSTTLQSNYELGNQWYFNGELIAGATGKKLEIKESGVYKLNVTTAGLCETSAEKQMIVTGLESALLEARQVYPNPVNDLLSIKLTASNGDAIGVIQNELGQTVGKVVFAPADDFLIGEFNFEEKMPGIYIVRITQGNSITNHKIVKK